jgi:hypothetical protein
VTFVLPVLEFDMVEPISLKKCLFVCFFSCSLFRGFPLGKGCLPYSVVRASSWDVLSFTEEDGFVLN